MPPLMLTVAVDGYMVALMTELSNTLQERASFGVFSRVIPDRMLRGVWLQQYYDGSRTVRYCKMVFLFVAQEEFAVRLHLWQNILEVSIE